MKAVREKFPKYGVISGLYFPVFSPNTEKCGPQKKAENINNVENSNRHCFSLRS